MPGTRASAAAAEHRARDVRVTGGHLVVALESGRTISVPLNWFPRLLRATPAQRRRWRLIAEGAGFHWPGIDEDLSVAGLLRGSRPRTVTYPASEMNGARRDRGSAGRRAGGGVPARSRRRSGGRGR